ncbi:uncharacterized protein FIBRA_08690 [Fibroporia radiculosa]|uniref:Cytochrome P450 n=1 Tax=Fibroporia radiculosa TaxID=599839 RepID=J4H5B1_9APHY|nr:uncharacterized protein FIBRA_08690 [Fibroporia radiculosa]CCM06429.1 predicted protein [Fibroporia radiculosa]
MQSVTAINCEVSAPVLRVVFGGFLTWLFLHRRSVRGDYATATFLLAHFSLFLATYLGNNDLFASIKSTLTLTIAYISSLVLCTLAYRFSPFHPLASYPGPRLWWVSSLWLTYVSYKGKRHLVLDDLHRIHGPFVRIAPNTLSINTLSANSIYSAQAHMEKSESYTAPGQIKAVSLFFKQKTEKLHNDRKKLWSAAFTGAAEIWSSEGELMKSDDPLRLVEGGKLATVLLDSVGQTPWLMDIIWHLPVGRSMVRLRDVAATMMRNRIKSNDNIQLRDLASFLLSSNPETGERIPHSDLEIEAVVAMQGGSDNTSTTMALAFYFMLANPTYYAMLQEELDNAFPDRAGDLDPTKLSLLPFLNAILQEALRLGSPFFLPRIVPAEGATIEGKYIPGGTIVALAAYSQQTSPENYWPDPLNFHPQRWLPGGLGPGSRTERTALFSFSSGPHICVAKAFAYQEMRLVVARLVLNYAIKFAKGFDIEAYREGILNMRTTILKRPLLVKATRRSTANLA